MCSGVQVFLNYRQLGTSFSKMPTQDDVTPILFSMVAVPIGLEAPPYFPSKVTLVFMAKKKMYFSLITPQDLYAKKRDI